MKNRALFEKIFALASTPLTDWEKNVLSYTFSSTERNKNIYEIAEQFGITGMRADQYLESALAKFTDPSAVHEFNKLLNERKTVSQTIYKYTLMPQTSNVLCLPASANILSAKCQGEHTQVWALVNPDEQEMSSVDFRTYGTGHPIEDDIEGYTFLDTVLLHNGELVHHIFYKML